MTALNLGKIANALRNETNHEIIKLLHQKPMTNMELYNQMKTTIVCRESIFKALNKLVDTGLVEKFYSKEKELRYRLPYSRYILDLIKETVEPLSRKKPVKK